MPAGGVPACAGRCWARGDMTPGDDGGWRKLGDERVRVCAPMACAWRAAWRGGERVGVRCEAARGEIMPGAPWLPERARLERAGGGEKDERAGLRAAGGGWKEARAGGGAKEERAGLRAAGGGWKPPRPRDGGGWNPPRAGAADRDGPDRPLRVWGVREMRDENATQTRRTVLEWLAGRLVRLLYL